LYLLLWFLYSTPPYRYTVLYSAMRFCRCCVVPGADGRSRSVSGAPSERRDGAPPSPICHCLAGSVCSMFCLFRCGVRHWAWTLLLLCWTTMRVHCLPRERSTDNILLFGAGGSFLRENTLFIFPSHCTVRLGSRFLRTLLPLRTGPPVALPWRAFFRRAVLDGTLNCSQSTRTPPLLACGFLLYEPCLPPLSALEGYAGMV